MFQLENSLKQDLALYIFLTGDQASPVYASPAYSLDELATRLPRPGMRYIGNVNIKTLLGNYVVTEEKKTEMNLSVLPEPRAMTSESFVASLRLSLDRFSDKLSKTDISAFKRIIKKLE